MSHVPEGMEDTGMRATAEEIKEAFRPRRIMSFADPSGGPPIPFEAETGPQYVHRIALEKGLPEIPGYYGLMRSGEIVKLKGA
jgi:hypothetical protein